MEPLFKNAIFEFILSDFAEAFTLLEKSKDEAYEMLRRLYKILVSRVLKT